MIHKYVKKPENIRQIGESPYSGPIYIEDYVMTYIRQIFKEQSEEKIILMLGKEGEELAKGSTFIYGAIGWILMLRMQLLTYQKKTGVKHMRKYINTFPE